MQRVAEPLGRTPRIYLFITLFRAIHYLRTLEKFRMEYKEIYLIPDPELRHTFSSQKEATKAEVNEFLTMTQIQGVPEFCRNFLPAVLLRILSLCLQSGEYDLG
jgi:hypothetical protein